MSKEPQDTMVSDMPPPPSPPPPPPLPPYSYQEQEPPAYSSAPSSHAVPKLESASIYQPVSGYESFRDIIPECQSDSIPLMTTPSSFDDDTVRRGFVRKVFSLLTLQLVFTFSVVCVFTFSTVVKEAVLNNLWAYISSFIIFAVVAIALSFCKSFSRRHPWNLVGLVVVTLSLSYMVGTIASYHNTTAVLITMAGTLLISLAIIAFSMQTRFDFTIFSGFLLILAVDLIMFGIICSFYYSYIADVAYGCLGALLYSLFLMVDCQLMMGMMSFRLDPEEYVTATLTLYLDIILIFLYLLGQR